MTMVKSYVKINNIFMRGKIVFPNKVDGEKSASFIFCNFSPPNFFNDWLARSQHFYICFAFNLLRDAIFINVYKENLASQRHTVVEGRSI